MMNIYQELNMANRDEAVIFLKSLICEKPQPCPICGGKLDFLHKKSEEKQIVIGFVKNVEKGMTL